MVIGASLVSTDVVEGSAISGVAEYPHSAICHLASRTGGWVNGIGTFEYIFFPYSI